MAVHGQFTHVSFSKKELKGKLEGKLEGGILLTESHPRKGGLTNRDNLPSAATDHDFFHALP